MKHNGLLSRLALLVAGFQFGAMSVGIGTLFSELPIREQIFYLVMYVWVFFICLKLATTTHSKDTYNKKNYSDTHPDKTIVS